MKRSTPEDREKIVALKLSGQTYAEISKATGFSVPTIGNIVKAAKPKRGRPKGATQKKATAQGGKGLSEIERIVSAEVNSRLKVAREAAIAAFEKALSV